MRGILLPHMFTLYSWVTILSASPCRREGLTSGARLIGPGTRPYNVPPAESTAATEVPFCM